MPAGWEAKAAMVDQCMGVGKRLTLWIAMLVAEGRADFADPSDWIRACSERWGWEKAHLHHMTSVGSLLLRPMPGVWHATLCDLHFDKVLAISRLPQNLLGPFLEKAMPVHLSRDEVRAAVNRWLKAAGEPGDEAPATKAIPAVCKTQEDFLDLLFATPAAGIGEIHAWQKTVGERAALAIHDADQAANVFLRSLAVCDAMVERMHGQQLLDVAANFRLMADAAEKLAANPKALKA
jgi:hypothetical protein